MEVQWNPQTFDHFWALLLSLDNNARKPVWLFFAAQCWALWNITNKFSIEHIFPNNAADCFFKTGLLLQQWRPLSKPKDLETVDLFISKLQAMYRETRSSAL